MARLLRFCICWCLFTSGLHRSLSAYELAIVSMFKNTAPYIKEWVEYHHMAGVDHFWLYDHGSTDHWKEVLQPYMDSGLVEVFDWADSNPDWVPKQMAAHADGARRAIGVAKWVALIDQDEFILPVKDGSIPECLNKRFPNAAAVYANWRNFGTSRINLAPGASMLVNLTSCTNRFHSRNCVGKSIMRPEQMEIGEIWSPHFCKLKPGATYYDGDGETSVCCDGGDLKTDGRSHYKYIRINHYAHRDERYFREVRLPRDAEQHLMLEHWEAYNEEKDRTILRFIKKYYPHMYVKYWAE